MSDNKPIRRVVIIGTGVIGASWASLFLAKGLDVVATDIAPDAETALRRFVKAAWPALERLGLAAGASQSRLSFTPDLPAALRGADFVQENGPERIDFKKKLYRQLDELLPADVIIASSSSGLTMSEIQSDCRLHPERCVIGHPFNPPHLVPLVEIVGGAKTSEATIERAAAFYTALGKQAVRLRKEVPGHVANRLQAALAREVYYLVAEDVVSVADVDKALCSPELTPEVQRKLIAGLHAEVGTRTVSDLEAQRDEILLGLLELRARHETPAVTSQKVARAG